MRPITNLTVAIADALFQRNEMKTMLKLGLFALCLPLMAHAAEPTEKDAIAMVGKAVAYAKANGKDKLVAEIVAKNPDFVQGELYVVVANMSDGVRLVSSNPKLVGKSILEMQDVDGKEYGKEMLDLVRAKGKGWVEYKYKNPVNGKIEPKKSYAEKSGDFVAFAGIYKN